jgi:hypothetical protein
MTMKMGRISANSVIATPSSRLKFSRLTANPLLEVRHMMPQGSDRGIARLIIGRSLVVLNP